MAKLKSTKKPNPYVRAIVIPVRINSEELREYKKKAHPFKGNISEMIRFAVEKLRLTKEDFEK